MAKQPKANTATAAPAPAKTPAPPAPAAPAPAKTPAPPAPTATPAERAERNKTDKFVRVIDPATSKGVVTAKKLAPQAQLIIDTIEAAGKGGVTREELNKLLIPAGLKTCQPVGRIVTYYQKSLVDAGTITIARESGEVSAPKGAAPVAEDEGDEDEGEE